MEKKRFKKFQKELDKNGYKALAINKSDSATFYYYEKKLDGYNIRFCCNDYKKPYDFSEEVDVNCYIEDEKGAWQNSTLSFMRKDYNLNEVEEKAKDFNDFIRGNKLMVEKPEFMQ